MNFERWGTMARMPGRFLRPVVPLVLTTTLVVGCAAESEEDGAGTPTSPTPASSSTSGTSTDSPSADPGTTEDADPSADTPSALLSGDLARDALATARSQVLDLTSLSPDTEGTLVPGLQQRSTGGFQGPLAGLVAQFSGDGSVSEGVVDAVGLETLDETSATVLVAASASVTETEGPEAPRYVFRVSLGRAGSAWLVDAMEVDDLGRGTPRVLKQTGLGRAADQVAELLSYTPADVVSGLDAESSFMTPAFERSYRRVVTTSIAPASRRRGITTTARVRAAGLSTGRAEEAGILVVMDLSANTGNGNDRTSQSWLRVNLRRVDGTWLLDDLAPL